MLEQVCGIEKKYCGFSKITADFLARLRNGLLFRNNEIELKNCDSQASE